MPMIADSWRVTVVALAVIACPLADASVPTPAISPPLDCRRLPPGSIDELVCKDEGLAELDRRMAEVMDEAQARAGDAEGAQLAPSQRRWLRSRNDCWKSREQRACVEKSYRLRIAILQASHGLLAGNGPIDYRCSDRRATDFRVTFYPTEPPTLIAEREGRRALLVLEASGSGSRYQSRNESFWEHQGEASIVWGRGSTPLRCRPAR